jgi:acylphosphatase
VKTIHVIISGRVQRVGFRACVKRIATDLKITGTVMNLADGKVLIYATGEPMILEKFVSMIYGCPRAVVREVKISDVPAMAFDDFSVIKGEGRISTAL